MKTSKEMQLKIIDKMRENVEEGKLFYKDLEYKDFRNEWVEGDGDVRLDSYEYRIKPETITINGVEIPKPLTKEDVGRTPSDKTLYTSWSTGDLNWGRSPSDLYHVMGDWSLIFRTKEEAIEASKALFGIKE